MKDWEKIDELAGQLCWLSRRADAWRHACVEDMRKHRHIEHEAWCWEELQKEFQEAAALMAEMIEARRAEEND